MLINLPEKYYPVLSRQRKIVFYNNENVDFLFSAGQDVVIYCVTLERAVNMHYGVSRNMYRIPFVTGYAEALPAYYWRITIPREKLLYPGFYDINIVIDHGDGTQTEDLCVFGYDAENMVMPVYRPDDFESFWSDSIGRLVSIPLNSECTHQRDYTGEEIDEYNMSNAAIARDYDKDGHIYESVSAYKVSFDSVGGKRIYGMLAKPIGDGPFPVMVIFPGAGNKGRPFPLEHARHGYLAIDINVHGCKADMELEEYPALPNGVNDGSFHYFKDVYAHIVQAVSYMASRNDADPGRIAVAGGSQGGRLSIACAALDKRVKAVVAAITWWAGMPYLFNAQKSQDDGMGREVWDACGNEAYYDVLNHAPDVKCPVLLNVGLTDGTSPAQCVYGMYQNLGTRDKKIVAFPSMGHDWSAAFDIEAWKWLNAKL